MISFHSRSKSQAEILGIGTGVPPFSVDSQVSAQFAAHSLCVGNSHDRKVQALYRRSGIQRRGSVLLEEEPGPEVVEHEFYPPAETDLDRGPGTQRRNDRFAQEAPALAYAASAAALADSGVAPSEITHLVTVTCTGFFAPGIDVTLIDQLGLPPTTQRVQVGFMGCHAAINGMRTAGGLASTLESSRILMCCVELCSLHMQYGKDADRIVSNALFADGAGAMVLANPSSVDVADATSPSTSRLPHGLGSLVTTGSYLVHQSADAMTWRIGDHGFEMTLSARVPELIERHLKAFVVPWLESQDESIDSIGGWAVHPGGPRILSSVESALQLPAEALEIPRSVLANRGNMSSATMLFILQQFAAKNQPKPWLLMGFGPGLEIEVALIR